MTKKQNNIGKYLYIAASAVLIIGFGSLLLEKTHVTNFYNRPTLEEVEENPYYDSNEDIDYSPATPTDNEPINSQKENDQLGNQNNTVEPGAPINVVLTAAGQDNPGGPVIVRVLLNDVSDGACTIILRQDGNELSYAKSVVNAGTYYNCEALDIPANDLANGTWNIEVVVSNEGRTGRIEQEIEVVL